VLETRLDLPVFARGKVRDTYELDGDRLLMVTTDRLSAFDRVLPTGIPDRGRVLAQLSIFWFQRTRQISENHFIEKVGPSPPTPTLPLEGEGGIDGRSMIVRRARRVDFECVVRGFLAGSAWAEYRQSGTMAGEPLPGGLRESERLPEPLFTPATKAETGHDENITFGRMRSELGADLAERIREASLRLYDFGRDHAERRGLILADTKFEFGLVDGRLILIDEALTPDSSRYWDAETYRVGTVPESFDKQFVRDWLSRSGWDRDSEPPELPSDIVEQTRQRYLTAYERLTGGSLE
jgi:phosphoribosylaminoimidazole-succinocarboxamide synthase